MSHEAQVFTGAACIVAGSWLLYAAFEGRRAPFWLKLLPGA